MGNNSFIALYDNHPDAVFTLDLEGNIINFNKSFKRIFGNEDKECTGNFQEYFDENFQEKSSNFQQEAIKGVAQSYTATLINKNGQPISADVKYIPILNNNQQVTGIFGISKVISDDIQSGKETNIIIKDLEFPEDFKDIFNNLEVWFWSFDLQKNNFLLSSPGIEKITGHTLSELRASYLSIIHPEDKERFFEDHRKVLEGVSLNENYRIFHKNGELRWIKTQLFPAYNSSGNIFRLDVIFTDITEYKKSEEMIKHIAYHDYFTNIPNRRFFSEKVTTLIGSPPTNKKSLGILYMVLGHFKNINSTVGNTTRDKLLQLFAHRISKILDNDSFLARLGSDEFGLIIWNYSEADYPIKLAEKIIEKLKNPFFIDQYEMYISISIGISSFPTDGDTSEELIKNSEEALYRAKVIGKNKFQIYSSFTNLNTNNKIFSLERDLKEAIKTNQFLVYFQPRVDTKTGKIVSAEALIRWAHPDWGLITPKEFIPLAEENGSIIEIEDWVLKQICHYIKEWEQSGTPPVPISLNKSPKVILRNDWTTNILSVLKETNIAPSLLEFEITETALLQTNEIVKRAFDLLQEVGIRVALDDFGTGYSSLTHLKEYPISTIKIDKSFVQNISNHRDNIIIKSIISLAKGLEIRVVAEGVETIEQLTFLKQQMCDEVQGYWFSKPLPKAEFEKLLKKGNT
ncbi:PAS domain S-box-containing protein/diguanylate cyclase (GGDEF)-like protein [Cytobacillus firmus]|uniref:PAS domain S-box-containing protein/diguanylate cyclase (GGDEF)-like protein n=2 Tax=Cytobacillus TaxID=2675230 RepID=A0A366JD86_CYTFI|nr:MULTISPECIES: EAL domain-containing protein [Cytobacillus]RBP84943.1 PAS domain S-box-containing protein/diguanylate cyclase (GGDEF)-like protein [Cytobacillus firmus]TDX36355.1 PAS domain S-box-containing protein/diguanylate cyclase (GGDEF)-like protein [Cytobacillus oceanisediminis]